MTNDENTTDPQTLHSSAMQGSDEQRAEAGETYAGAAESVRPQRTENAGTAASSSRQHNATPHASGGKKLLCVEDEHFIGELYDRALTKAGYDVTVVLDGLEGLKEAQSDKYDIILLDLMVPNMTGIEILRRLRDPAQTPRLHGKIIITTNLEQREEIRADIERQADGYLVKAEITPRELAEFLNTIQ